MTDPTARRSRLTNIVVSGHNVEVPEHFRVHVAEKMAHLERYDDTIDHFAVELFHENNHRQSTVYRPPRSPAAAPPSSRQDHGRGARLTS
ncbi:MAG: ribosome-associated translation inhibitor RaiA [Pseudonocardiales bacterium]|nr:MAG: ribosome-associated translation inhibitor RaiA [Pseudonocardiales bacterium]